MLLYVAKSEMENCGTNTQVPFCGDFVSYQSHVLSHKFQLMKTSVLPKYMIFY